MLIGCGENVDFWSKIPHIFFLSFAFSVSQLPPKPVEKCMANLVVYFCRVSVAVPRSLPFSLVRGQNGQNGERVANFSHNP